MRVFKYRTVNEYTRRIICNDELYFARPDQFNDPFDCRLDILDSLDREASRAEASAAFRALAIDTGVSMIQRGTHERYDQLNVREAIRLRFVNAYEDELGVSWSARLRQLDSSRCRRDRHFFDEHDFR